MLTNIVHRWRDILSLQHGNMVLPHFVDFHTTDICNQNCNGCAYRGQFTDTVMHRDLHFKAVYTFLDNGVRAFDFAGGGEPTMTPYLWELMEYIAANGGNFALITNGTMLNERLVDVLLKHGTYLRVSLEASNAEDYAKYKGVRPEVFDKVCSSIDKIVYAKRMKNSKLEVSLKFSVGKSLRGIQHYKDMMMLAMELEVDRLNVKSIRHDPEELSVSERFAEQVLFDECMRNYDIQGWPRISRWIAPELDRDVPQCWLNPLHTVMDHLGNIYVCCYYYYRREEFILGNIFQQDFKQIWFSENHWKKIQGIKRDECMKVDCKFFAHHKTVKQMQERGMIYWL